MSSKIKAVMVMSKKAQYVLDDLRYFRASRGPWPCPHQVREGVIRICIGEGIGDLADILYLMKQLKIDRDEVLDTLRQYEGDDPTLHRWKRDGSGCYQLLTKGAAPAA